MTSNEHVLDKPGVLMLGACVEFVTPTCLVGMFMTLRQLLTHIVALLNAYLRSTPTLR